MDKIGVKVKTDLGNKVKMLQRHKDKEMEICLLKVMVLLILILLKLNNQLVVGMENQLVKQWD